MKFLKRIFKRKRYTPVTAWRKTEFEPGGYPTPADTFSRPRSGEMIISREQSVFANEIKRAIREIEKEEIEVSEADVAGIVKRAGEIAVEFGEIDENVQETIRIVAETINRKLNALQQEQEHKTNCPNCGAPLKDGKCEYCGTTYNN